MKFTKYALASAVALGLAGAAWADGDPLVADGLDNWSDLTVKPGTGKTATGGNGETVGAVWFGNPEDTTVTAYDGSGVSAYDKQHPGGLTSEPNFLKVSQSSVLWRVLNEYTYKYGEGEDAPQKFEDMQEDVEEEVGEGLFVDTLVQFTPSEEAPDVVTGSKLIVWMDVNSNLCVTANKASVVDGSLTSFDFVTGKELKPNTWYRLTVKAYADILDADGTIVHGFKVFIDKSIVSSEDAKIDTDTDEFEDYFELVKTGFADDIYDGKVFFSLDTKDSTAHLAAVGFRGEGLVDDIVVTTEDPIPDETVTTIDFTLTWGADVSAVWYAINDSTNEVNKASPATFELPADSVGATIAYGGRAADAWSTVVPATATLAASDNDFTVVAVAADTAADAGVENAAFADWTPAEVKAAFGDEVTPAALDAAAAPELDYQFGQVLNTLSTKPSLEIIGIAQNATNSTLWDITVQVVAGETALSIDNGSKSTMRASLQVIASDTIAGLASTDPAEYDLAFDETATDLTISVPAADGQFFKAAIVYTDAKPTVTPPVNQEPEEQSGNDNP